MVRFIEISERQQIYIDLNNKQFKHQNIFQSGLLLSNIFNSPLLGALPSLPHANMGRLKENAKHQILMKSETKGAGVQLVCTAAYIGGKKRRQVNVR